MTNSGVIKNIKSKRKFCRQSLSEYFEIFWVLILRVFRSLQVKPCATEIHEHSKYELSHELSSELRLRILGT